MKPLLLGSTGYIGQKFAQKINCVKMKHQDVSVRNLLRSKVDFAYPKRNKIQFEDGLKETFEFFKNKFDNIK